MKNIDHYRAVITGMAASQTQIAISAARRGLPAEISALEAGTAIGLTLALDILATACGSEEAKRVSRALRKAGRFEELALAQVKSIHAASKNMPKNVADELGISVTSGATNG